MPSFEPAQWVCSLVADDQEIFIPIGSCVLIASNIAITAKHNLEGAMQEIVTRRNKRAPAEGGNAHVPFGFAVIGADGGLWSVTQSSMANIYDIAVLRLYPFNDAAKSRNSYPEIRLCGPDVGEKVVAFGYPEQEIADPTNLNSYKRELKHAVGPVIEVFAAGRDASFHTPCFACETDFPHGMSGGGVFDRDGRLCGTVSFGSPGDPPISYAALPATAAVLTINWMEGNPLMHALFRQTEGPFKVVGVQRVFLATAQDTEGYFGVVIGSSEQEVGEYVKMAWKRNPPPGDMSRPDWLDQD